MEDVPLSALENVPAPPPENMRPEGLQEYVVGSLDELRRDAKNREAEQAECHLRVQRARQEREDEQWRHEQQQQRLMREKEQRARLAEQAEFERLQQKRAREAAKDQETVERLGKRTYLREDLEQAHLSGKR